MCFGSSKEQSHHDDSFEYPQHMFWLRKTKNNFQLRTVIWGPALLHLYAQYSLSFNWLQYWPKICIIWISASTQHFLDGESILTGGSQTLLQVITKIGVAGVSPYILSGIVWKSLFAGILTSKIVMWKSALKICMIPQKSKLLASLYICQQWRLCFRLISHFEISNRI